MDTRQLMENFEHLSLSARLLTCFDDVLQKPAGRALQRLLDAMAENDPDEPEMILAYQAFVRALAREEPSLSLPNYILKEILDSDNAFSNRREPLDAALSGAILNDLETLQRLALLSSEVVRDEIRRRYIVNARDVYLNLVGQLPLFSEELSEEEIPASVTTPVPRLAWRQMYRSLRYCLEEGKILTALPRLSEFYRHYGAGIWNKYQFLRYDAREEVLLPRTEFPAIHPEKLLDPESVLEALFESVAGWLKDPRTSAEPILLRGPVGSGKTTAIGALATYFTKDDLLVIDLPGESAEDLPRVIELLRDCPQKVLIVCDDLRLNPDEARILARALDEAPQQHPRSWRFLATLRVDGEGQSPLDAGDLSYQALLARFGLELTLPTLDEDRYVELSKRLTSGHGFNWSDDFKEAFASDVARGGTLNYRRMNRTLMEALDALDKPSTACGNDVATPLPK